jgi:hypothetical protein
LTVRLIEGFGGFALCAISIIAGILLAYCAAGLIISSQPPTKR